jgi:polyferredoxin
VGTLEMAQQLECINCTACIDECNDVMLKMKKPEGLIRYGVDCRNYFTGIVKRVTFRSVAYTTILVVLNEHTHLFINHTKRN